MIAIWSRLRGILEEWSDEDLLERGRRGAATPQAGTDTPTELTARVRFAAERMPWRLTIDNLLAGDTSAPRSVVISEDSFHGVRQDGAPMLPRHDEDSMGDFGLRSMLMPTQVLAHVVGPTRGNRVDVDPSPDLTWDAAELVVIGATRYVATLDFDHGFISRWDAYIGNSIARALRLETVVPN